MNRVTGNQSSLTVFVINLASSVDRRTWMQSQLDALHIPFEFFKAVDGCRCHHPLFDRYDDNKRKRHKRYRLSAAELGCFASHTLLWQRCVELNRPIVVMEDDVVLSSHFGGACSCAANVIETYGYIRLFGLFKRPYVDVDALGAYRVVRYLHGPAGTQCYMIHPAAALRLLKHSRQWYCPVDDYLDTFWLHQVDCFALLPYALKLTPSVATIQRDVCIHDHLGDRFKRAIRRHWGKIERHVYNWTYPGRDRARAPR